MGLKEKRPSISLDSWNHFQVFIKILYINITSSGGSIPKDTFLCCKNAVSFLQVHLAGSQGTLAPFRNCKHFNSLGLLGDWLFKKNNKPMRNLPTWRPRQEGGAYNYNIICLCWHCFQRSLRGKRHVTGCTSSLRSHSFFQKWKMIMMIILYRSIESIFLPRSWHAVTVSQLYFS